MESEASKRLNDLATGPYADLAGSELYRQRQVLLGELGRVDIEMDRRRAGQRRLVKSSELEWVEGKSMNPTSSANKICQIISPELGFDIHNFHVFMIEVPPFTEHGTYHRHGDAVKYYLSGRGVEIVDGEPYEVEAGDFLHVPANVWHETTNPYDEPCRFLAAQQLPGTYSQIPAAFLDRSTLPPDDSA